MSRFPWRGGALAALLVALLSGMAAPATAAGSTGADSWFAQLTPAQILPFVHTFPSWRSQGSSDPKALSFGAAAPTLGYSLPAFDLATGRLRGSNRLSDGLTPTGGYCARLLVKGSPTDVVVCADPAADGSGYQLSGASDVPFLGAAPALPSGGTTAPDHNFIGVVGGSVVPLDQPARAWLGASRLDGPVFVRLVAQRIAEWAAVNRMHGPTLGGDPPLIGGDRARIAAFVTAVSRASGVPASRLAHPWTVADVEGSAHRSAPFAGWIVPTATLTVLIATALIATLRRQRRVAARP